VFFDRLFAGDGPEAIRADLQRNILSIGHFVRVYVLVERSDGYVKRTAADAFLAAETRKVGHADEELLHQKGAEVAQTLAANTAGNKRGLH
jgi:hypothetical protein